MTLQTDFLKWENHSDLEITRYNGIKSIDKTMFKNIKIQLIRKVNGEIFKYKNSDPIWVAYNKKKKKKILGIFMVSDYSPDFHFNNECDYTDEGGKIMNTVPYLYNVIVNVINKDAKKLKVSLSLMMRVKRDIAQDKTLWSWLNKENPKQPKFINLDAPCQNDHAIKFYQKNGFTLQNELYETKKIDYQTMIYTYA